MPTRLPRLCKQAAVLVALHGLTLWGAAGATSSPTEPDLATEDVRTPVALTVVDAEATARQREHNARTAPPIYRFLTERVEDVPSRLRVSFHQTRRQFLDSLEVAAGRRKLDAATVHHPSFARFVDWFRKRRPEFPLSGELAEIWALHEPDNPVLDDWVGRVSRMMSQCIHSDRQDSPLDPGAGPARMISVSIADETLTLKSLEKRGVEVARSSLFSLSQARNELLGSLAGAESPLGRYLAEFLQVNCALDEDLTRQNVDRRLAEIRVLDHYRPGQWIVRRGQPITLKTRAALEALRAQPDLAEAQTTNPAVVTPGLRDRAIALWKRLWLDPRYLESTARQSLGVLAGGCVLLVALMALLIRRRRARKISRAKASVGRRDDSYTVILNPNRNETIFIPLKDNTTVPDGEAVASGTRPEAGTVTSGAADEPAEAAAMVAQSKSVPVAHDQFWQERAMTAERRAEEILAMVRAGLAPQLARQMMSKLVQELITQRAEWLQTQRVVEHDLLEIERRFTRSHAQLVDRLRAFERRADDLEKALALKTEENSELLKAHIAMTKDKASSAAPAKEMMWN